MSGTTRRVKKREVSNKKKCGVCLKEKDVRYFYKVESPLFPDGLLNFCNACVRQKVDIEDIESVISFLRQIDKPFIQSFWDESINSGKYPLGEYIRKVNSTHSKNKTFDDSDGFGVMGSTSEIKSNLSPDTIEAENGEIITYSESLVNKWGSGYQKNEYLILEKFYQDMTQSYEVHTANHKQMLMQLSKLSVEMDKLLAIKDYNNYSKVSKVFDDLLDSTGFAPKDKKNGADAIGLSSFSQVWAETEREGFIPPKLVHYDRDDIDYMLLYYMQFAQRLVGKSVSTEPNRNWRDEVIIDDEE